MGLDVITAPPPEARQEDPFQLVRLSDIQEREMEWLVPGYLAYGGINLLFGDGGVGKTFIWNSLAAAITTGQPTIFERDLYDPPERKPRNIIYFSAEDSSSEEGTCNPDCMRYLP